MTRLFHAILLGIVGAAIVHIAVLLMLPAFAERDAWSRLAALGDYGRVVRLGPNADGALGDPDPFIAAAACRFDLSAAGMRLSAGRAPGYWSVSIYNRRGHNVYSLNDRTANGGALDLVVVSPAQMLELRKGVPEELANAILVETGETQGIVVVRTFQPDPTFAPAVDAFFSSARCEPV